MRESCAPGSNDPAARHIARHAACAVTLASALIVAGSVTASAQLVVHDTATTARNRITATLSQYLYDVQRGQHDKILEMARRLSALTNLRKYALAGAPRWRTHGSTGFLYAPGYLDALTFGDSTG